MLSFALANPDILLIFKSKFIKSSLSEIIEKDNDLKKLYNKNQILELKAKSTQNTRNIISPSEIGQIADICIGRVREALHVLKQLLRLQNNFNKKRLIYLPKTISK